MHWFKRSELIVTLERGLAHATNHTPVRWVGRSLPLRSAVHPLRSNRSS